MKRAMLTMLFVLASFAPLATRAQYWFDPILGKGRTGQKQNLSATVAPTANDDSGDGYVVGSTWIDTVTGNAYIATDVTTGAAVWDLTNSSGAGDVVGPASATDGAVVLYDGTTGKLLKDSTAAGVRSLLNVEDGADVTDATNVAASGAVMDSDFTIDGGFLVGTAAGTFAEESGATARTSLGLGTIATQDSNSVSITGGAISGVTGLLGSDIGMSEIGTATYDDVQDYINQFSSAGCFEMPTITDNGDGTVAVGACKGLIRTTNDVNGAVVSFDFAGDASVALTDLVTNWIGLDYNAGTPQVVVETSVSDLNLQTEIVLGRVYRDGTTATPYAVGQKLTDYRTVACFHDFETHGTERSSGLVLSETGTRNMEVSAGVFYCAHNRVTTAAIDTSGADTYNLWNSSASTTADATAQTQWPNTQYWNGAALADVTNNRYGNLFAYVDFAGNLHMQYGDQNAVAVATPESSDVPTPPAYLRDFCLYIGRLVFQKSAGTAELITNPFAFVEMGSVVTSHNDLAALDGGTAGEYYHLTSAQHTIATTPAATAQDGYLVQADWNTFNGKLSAESDTLNDVLNRGATSNLIPILSNNTGNTITFGAGAAGVDYKIGWNGEDNDGTITFMEDEALFSLDQGLRIVGAGNYLGVGADPTVDLHVQTTNTSCFNVERYANDGNQPIWMIRKSRGGSLGTVTETQSGDVIGALEFQGVNSTPGFNYGARIKVVQTAAASASRAPCSMTLSTWNSASENTSQMVLNSDGTTDFGYAVTALTKVEDEPTTDTITAAQCHGSVITNTGSTGATVYTLPAATKGMVVQFTLTVAQDVDVNPNGTDLIVGYGCSAGDAISSDATKGTKVTLQCLVAGEWDVVGDRGTWTDVD
jgi:hypothetical protein